MIFTPYWVSLNSSFVPYVEIFGGYERIKSYWTNYRSFFWPVKNPKFKLKNLKTKDILKFKIHRDESIREYNYGDSYFQVKTVEADTLHKIGLTGKGVKVGIFDTGFDLSHNSLRGVLVADQIDFNSGDRINHNGVPIPTPSGTYAFYIQSYDCARNYCVFSGISEKDIAGTNINRWDLYLATLSTSWSIKRISTGLEINPKLVVKNDTVYITWSSYGFLRMGYISGDSLGGVWNLTSGYVAYMDTSSDTITLSIYSPDSIKLCSYYVGLVCHASEYISYFGGIWVSGDSLFYSDGDSIFVLTKSGKYFKYLGFYPVEDGGRLAYIRNDSLFVDGRFITYEKFLENFGFYRDSLAVPRADYISIIRVSDGKEIGRVGWTFCDKPSFVDGKLIYRERGDTIAEPPSVGSGRYHGTRVLSVMAGYVEGTLIGISPGATYYLAKTEKISLSDSSTNWENVIEEDFYVAALEWAARRGVKIVNVSLGYGSDLGYTKGDMDGKTAISSMATSEALSKGILPVVSIGNVPSRSVDPAVGDTTLTAPSDAFDIVSVGGVIYDSTTESITLSSNSACGPSSDGRVKPEVVAPFEVVAADDSNRTVIVSGTSYSAPITAGVLALALEAHPSWDLKKLRSKLLETAKPLEGIPLRPNYCTGYGLVNAKDLVFSEPIEVGVETKELVFKRIYPNPASKERDRFINFVIRSMFPTTDPVIRIYTVSGVMAKEIKILGNKNVGEWMYKVDISGLDEGLYIAVIMTERGTATAKFVIKK